MEKNCLVTTSDSGTVQEKVIFKTMFGYKRIYERPETIKAGSAVILNNNIKKMKAIIIKALTSKIKIKNIKDYSSINVSNKILKILKNY